MLAEVGVSGGAGVQGWSFSAGAVRKQILHPVSPQRPELVTHCNYPLILNATRATFPIHLILDLVILITLDEVYVL
jgi:hypothetical protein